MGTKKVAKNKKTKSALSTRLRFKYTKPAIYVLAFMLVGLTSLAWASAATTTYGLWSSKAVPKVITASDKHSLELGTKFQSKVAGQVKGVRFYKGAQNTGSHTGSLWDRNGRLLATVTFKGETKSGWQSATFDQPVSIAANVTYVVSYHAPSGRYSVNFNYFNDSSHINKKLTALKASRFNANGVYRYSNQTTFPSEDGSGANYWVDVIFSAKLISAPVAPAAPANVVANLQGTKNVALGWQASVSANPVATYDVYRNGDKIATTASTNYTDSSGVAGKTYEYTVKAVDVKGSVSAASTKVVIQLPSTTTPNPTPVPTPTPPGGGTGGGNGNGGSGGTGSSVTLFNASKKEIAMRLVSSAENSSLDWKSQFSYIEDIKDGRGYTAGIIGFCSGTSDMLAMVQYYSTIAPNNILAKYIPALQKVNGTASHTGLGNPFVADWKTAANDPKFQEAQIHERDTGYFNPAVNQAVSDGVHALGQFIYYDAMVMHGPGNDAVSFGGIRATALKKAKTPAQGGNETTYLNAFLDARKAAMLSETAHEDTGRVDTEQRVFLQKGNLNLDVPLQWSVYGDSYSITTNP